jgi:chloramphenicol 3-O phosphotransferase
MAPSPPGQNSVAANEGRALSAAAKIVLLNGVGSSGKSSVAKALQTMTAEPFLHVQMDAFVEMLPEAFQDHPDGFAYETVQVDGDPVVAIRAGPAGRRALQGMRHAVAAMAEQGNNLIIDDVLCNGEMPDYVTLLSAFDLHLVGVFAPLDILEARERARVDRLIGLARWQYGRVHEGIGYDLEIDTSTATAVDCAKQIQARFRL